MITGGTGFIGTHLCHRLGAAGHECVLLARGRSDVPDVGPETTVIEGSVADPDPVAEACVGADAVCHLAGINYERGDQTYEAVHVRGTAHVVEAAEAAGVDRIVLSSYLRARPDGPGAYLQSKWAAEELVRDAGPSGTVAKIGLVFGPGDQLLTSVARTIATAPIFPGFRGRDPEFRPVSVDDVVSVLAVAAVEERLADATVGVNGPEPMTLSELVPLVGTAMGRSPRVVPTPIAGLRLAAWAQERLFARPLITRAGVQMLAAGATEPAPAAIVDDLPVGLVPQRALTVGRVEDALGDPKRIGIGDLRFLGR